MNVNLGLLTASALLLAVPAATAFPNPPPGATDNCLGGGYNPGALVNVCYDDGPSTPDHTGTVGTTPGPCIIGETCVPIPIYDPAGGTTLPSVAVPFPTYADVNLPGVVQCEVAGTGIQSCSTAACQVAESRVQGCNVSNLAYLSCGYPAYAHVECVISAQVLNVQVSYYTDGTLCVFPNANVGPEVVCTP